jgi:sorbitol-specific phosphotransferase system component IIBC
MRGCRGSRRVWDKIYKLCDSLGYTHNMTVYLGKDRKLVTPTMTTTHQTVAGRLRKTENLGNKLYIDNAFSSPELFDDLHTKVINCCGTVRPNRKGMPRDFGKTLKLKWGNKN